MNIISIRKNIKNFNQDYEFYIKSTSVDVAERINLLNNLHEDSIIIVNKVYVYLNSLSDVEFEKFDLQSRANIYCYIMHALKLCSTFNGCKNAVDSATEALNILERE